MQKLLSAAGIGSRREVERWIREGRLRINGELPVLGARLGERDRVTLDGRPVRLQAAGGGEGHVLLYHRAPGTPLDLPQPLRAPRNSSACSASLAAGSQFKGCRRWTGASSC